MDFVRPVEAVVGGAQGRLLAVLLETTRPLTLRRLASLAGVSPAQASRVMPRLVELGIVDRHEVPPASQFLLVRDCVVTQLLLALADARSMALRQIGDAVSATSPQPVSVVAFGSFAAEKPTPTATSISRSFVQTTSTTMMRSGQSRSMHGADRSEPSQGTTSRSSRQLPPTRPASCAADPNSGGTSNATGSSFTGGRSTNSQADCVPIGHSQMVGTG